MGFKTNPFDQVEAIDFTDGKNSNSKYTSRVGHKHDLALLDIAKWQDWVPAAYQTATITTSTAAGASRYKKIGPTIIGRGSVDLASAGTAGAEIQLSLPFPVYMVDDNPIGYFLAKDTGTTFYSGVIICRSVNNVVLHLNSFNGFLGFLPAWTIANGDFIKYSFSYETTS